MNQYKAIIFDFDGVIFDSEPIHFQACNQVFVNLGFTLPYDFYLEHYVGLADAEMFPLILDHYRCSYTQEEVKAMIAQKIKAYEEILHKAEDLSAVKGLLPFLEKHHRHLAFAICSASTRKELASALAKLEQGQVGKYFEIITPSEEVSLAKPSPEGYLKTAAKLQVNPQDCLVIEDTQKGILAAKNAGMQVIGLTTTQSRNKLALADQIAANFEELS